MRPNALIALAIVAGCATPVVMPTPEAREALAPGGKLRVALNMGNPALVRRQGEDLAGIAVDLGHALAARLDAEFVAVPYPNAGALVEGAKNRGWDIAFAAIDPARADLLAFTAPYMEVGNTLLVPAGSPIRAVADADRRGTRIAVGAKNAADLYLTRNIRDAELVRLPDTLEAAMEVLQNGKADVYAGNNERLLIMRESLAGYRMLEGRYYSVEHAIAVPHGSRAAVGFASAFVEELKSSGAVAKAIMVHGLRGVNVAPSAKGSAAAGR